MIKLKTGEVADLLNVSKRTIQNWLARNKITEPPKNDSGYYEWDEEDIRHAREYLQTLKLTTKYKLRER